MPSAFLASSSKRMASKRMAGKQKITRSFVYDRDIICLPNSHLFQDGLIKIPRKKTVRDYLASNRLIGKIRLHSEMSDVEIMTEIRSVFREPMDNSDNFPFKRLQMSGGSSKTLSEPV